MPRDPYSMDGETSSSGQRAQDSNSNSIPHQTGNNPEPRWTSRTEYRHILRKIVEVLQAELDIPGVSPFGAAELATWFHEVTTEDIQSVWDEVKSRNSS